jgi:hypothetical protein
MPFADKAYTGCNKEIKEIYDWSLNKNVPFFGLTATAPEPAAAFAKEHKLGFGFFAADQKMLMTLARYNPTLYLFNGSVVVKKWSGRNLPSVSSLEKLIKK